MEGRGVVGKKMQRHHASRKKKSRGHTESHKHSTPTFPLPAAAVHKPVGPIAIQLARNHAGRWGGGDTGDGDTHGGTWMNETDKDRERGV